MSTILVFAPYAAHRLHTLYEGTIAQACAARGARIEYLLCDGLFPECDMHWDAFVGAPRPFDLCNTCQAKARSNLAEVGLECQWLGSFIPADEKERAFEWAHRLLPTELPSATFENYAVGEWVMSSVSSFFRSYPPDLQNWRTVHVYRALVYSSAVTILGLQHFLATHQVDAVMMFNGRQSVTRVALELFKMRGIRALTHERPLQQGHLNIRPNASCISLAPFRDLWQAWGDIPLSRPQLQAALGWLMDRRYGRNTVWKPFNTRLVAGTSIREQFHIAPTKRLVAMLPSSMDEIAAEPEWQGAYEDQSLWVEEVVQWAASRSEIEMIIRVHPNLSNSSGKGIALNEITYFRDLATRLPQNVHMVMPEEKLNTYALMDEADVGLTFGSTAGIEMAMLGKPVVLASRAFYEHGIEIQTVRAKQDLVDTLDRSLAPPSKRAIQREAFRLVYHYFFRLDVPFPLVSMVGWHDGQLHYARTEELVPGRDASLDHICNYLMYGQALYPAPAEVERTRTTEAEELFFDELEQTPEPLRDQEYEHKVARINRLNRLSHTTQDALNGLPFGVGTTLIQAARVIYRPVLRWVEKGV